MAQLSEHLVALGYLVGRTWRGEFADSTPEKPLVDVMRWESILNGNAIRIEHSVNRGEYGGETIIQWEPVECKVVYYYFTTAGFHTRGTMELAEHHSTSHEEVRGNANGVTAVKSHTHLTPDGHVRVVSQYFKSGSWVEGHSVTYEESPDEEVVFR